MNRSKKQKLLKYQFARRAKLFLVPHRHNQYRPHAIRRYGLVLVLLAVVGLQAGYNAVTTGSVLGSEASVSITALLEETNAERERHGVPTLRVSDKLSQAAYLKASDMFHKQYWDHVSPDGTTPWEWLANVDYNYKYAGENLAKNFTTAATVTSAWMSSPGHKDNLLNKNYTEVGFAVVAGKLHDKPTTLVVAMYGAPATSPVAATGETTYAPAGSIDVLTRLGLAVQSLTPAALGSIVILVLASVVALAAHFYRHKLPKNLRKSWYRHHGLAKAGGLMGVGVIILVLYGTGQI